MCYEVSVSWYERRKRDLLKDNLRDFVEKAKAEGKTM